MLVRDKEASWNVQPNQASGIVPGYGNGVSGGNDLYFTDDSSDDAAV